MLVTLTILNILGLFLSPVIAVVVTLLWQRRKEKRDRQEHLFLVMMAHRRRSPPSQDWVDALNLIDVVFAKHAKVLSLWHEYYDLLASANFANEAPKRAHKYLELLSEMARVLGYKHLQQTDIDKYYSPVAHGNEADTEWHIRQELLRVLRNTEHLLVPHYNATTPPASPTPEVTAPTEPANQIGKEQKE